MDEMHPMVELLFWTSVIPLAAFLAGIIDALVDKLASGKPHKRFEKQVGPADTQKSPHFWVQMRHRFEEPKGSAVLGWSQHMTSEAGACEVRTG